MFHMQQVNNLIKIYNGNYKEKINMLIELFFRVFQWSLQKNVKKN